MANVTGYNRKLAVILRKCNLVEEATFQALVEKAAKENQLLAKLVVEAGLVDELTLLGLVSEDAGLPAQPRHDGVLPDERGLGDLGPLRRLGDGDPAGVVPLSSGLGLTLQPVELGLAGLDLLVDVGRGRQRQAAGDQRCAGDEHGGSHRPASARTVGQGRSGTRHSAEPFFLNRLPG